LCLGRETRRGFAASVLIFLKEEPQLAVEYLPSETVCSEVTQSQQILPQQALEENS